MGMGKKGLGTTACACTKITQNHGNRTLQQSIRNINSYAVCIARKLLRDVATVAMVASRSSAFS